MKLPTALICTILYLNSGWAQSGQDSLAYIEASQNPQYPNVYTFSVANEPPLYQIAGAPKAHYGYFWEFGDGTYSFAKSPTHVYTDSTNNEKKVVVSLTNNYGSGGAPRMRPKKIKPENKKSPPETLLKEDDKESSPLSKNESINLFTNHSPRPGDPIVSVLSYQNTDNLLPENGRIYIFYNEKEFDYPNFVFEDTRIHHNEIFNEGMPQDPLSSNYENKVRDEEYVWASAASEDVSKFMVNSFQPTSIENAVAAAAPSSNEKFISESKKIYKNAISWEYNNLKPGEKRNIFSTFLCSREMVVDTSKTITIRTVIVPENKNKTREYTLKMVIQSSHDPNKLSVSDRRLKKRIIKRKGITYKVDFQNVGKGAATNIRVVTNLHETLDPSSIEIIDYHPKAALCLNIDTTTYSCLDSTKIGQEIKWQFNNVYLPGVKQDDRASRKATKGWIEFSVKPKKRFSRKDVIDARSEIYFDKNEPIRTNRVRTRVLKNWSYGLKAGFAETPLSFDYMMLGATFASFRPRGFYLQPEVMFTSLAHEGATREIIGEFILAPDGTQAEGDETTRQSFQIQYLDIIPLQVRTNITPFASIGAGFTISWLLKAKEILEIDRTYYPTRINNFEPPFPPYSERSSSTVYSRFGGNKDERFSSIETGFFLDVQGGLVNKGPCLGFRYQMRSGKRPADEERSERQSNNTFQVYVKMRF